MRPPDFVTNIARYAIHGYEVNALPRAVHGDELCDRLAETALDRVAQNVHAERRLRGDAAEHPRQRACGGEAHGHLLDAALQAGAYPVVPLAERVLHAAGPAQHDVDRERIVVARRAEALLELRHLRAALLDLASRMGVVERAHRPLQPHLADGLGRDVVRLRALEAPHVAKRAHKREEEVPLCDGRLEHYPDVHDAVASRPDGLAPPQEGVGPPAADQQHDLVAGKVLGRDIWSGIVLHRREVRGVKGICSG